jgi:hypothetical protein
MTNYLIVPVLVIQVQSTGKHFLKTPAIILKELPSKNGMLPFVTTGWPLSIKRFSDYDAASVILIGHSLGCTTIAHWTTRYKKKIKGALLVAPSDVEAQGYTFPAKGFSPTPTEKINFKTIVVASEMIHGFL